MFSHLLSVVLCPLFVCMPCHPNRTHTHRYRTTHECYKAKKYMSDVTPNKNVAGCYTKSHNVDVSIHLYGLRMFKMDGNLKAKGFCFFFWLSTSILFHSGRTHMWDLMEIMWTCMSEQFYKKKKHNWWPLSLQIAFKLVHGRWWSGTNAIKMTRSNAA